LVENEIDKAPDESPMILYVIVNNEEQEKGEKKRLN
jgi:hypothetical protein